MEQTKLVPKRRFKEFQNTSAWEQRKLGEMGDTFTGLSGKTKEDFGHGDAKFVTYINVFSNPISDPYGTESVEIDSKQKEVKYGDVFFTTSSETPEEVGMSSVWLENTENVYLNSFCFGYRPTVEFDPYYLAFMLRSPVVRKKFMFLAQGISRYNISKNKVMDMLVSVPTLEEQKKVGAFYKELENLITLHQRKLEKMKALKSAYLSEMFPAEGERVPKRRFAGFTQAWEQRKLGEMMEVTSVKRIHQSDWTDEGVRFLRARDIVCASKGEEPTDYLYISQEKYDEYSRISGKVKVGDLLVTGVGTIGVPLLVTQEEPLYFKDGNIIWFKNEKQLDGNFFYYSFIGESIQKYIRDVAGIGTVGTYTIDSGKKTPIQIPSYEEQEKIGNFFKQLDHLITLHQRKLEKLQNIKKAYLNEMFV
ncbi:restriction endonuclease subunit S [Heyndrickxia coagulans]|nr:restriction endonuclease subunit S [Heyndrickxia coagulans]AVD57304.1 restriction endonuclease subunit S [Heyndrickxia coagulans]